MAERNDETQRERDGEQNAAMVRLNLRPERRLIRRTGSSRHVDFVIDASAPPIERTDRPPVSVALVIDRSGSMQGEKLQTAKRAALTVIDRLGAQDEVAVVVFDDHVDVVQPAAPVDNEVKARVRAELNRIAARASTDVHAGWLVGCQQIAAERAERPDRLARCFLLTDGQANRGVVDFERIAAEAGGVWQHAGITTSTFGIGADYDERLLGPMAVAGGGQFHHLRNAREIATAFVGELGGLLGVIASRATLEIEADDGATPEIISRFPFSAQGARRWTAVVGDLVGGEQRHLVVRFTFPAPGAAESIGVRGRLVFTVAGESRATDWQEVRFSPADHRECDAERYDIPTMRWVARHHADWALIEAVDLNLQGEYEAARHRLRAVARRIQQYAGEDTELLAIVAELMEGESQFQDAPMPALPRKERYALAISSSRSLAR